MPSSVAAAWPSYVSISTDPGTYVVTLGVGPANPVESLARLDNEHQGRSEVAAPPLPMRRAAHVDEQGHAREREAPERIVRLDRNVLRPSRRVMFVEVLEHPPSLELMRHQAGHRKLRLEQDNQDREFRVNRLALAYDAEVSNQAVGTDPRLAGSVGGSAKSSRSVSRLYAARANMQGNASSSITSANPRKALWAHPGSPP